MAKVRKYHEGGKGPGHPHPGVVTQSIQAWKDLTYGERWDYLTSAASNIYNWRENIAENITPKGYGSELNRISDSILLDKKDSHRRFFDRSTNDEWSTEADRAAYGRVYPNGQPQNKEREDLFNMLLGRDQVHNSMSISEDRPTISTDPDAIYYASKVTDDQIRNLFKQYVAEGTSNTVQGRIDDVVNSNAYGKTLGHFTINQGEDEKGSYVSYYDKWDLNPWSKGDGALRTIEDTASSIIGLDPAEVYGRVYYDPATGVPIGNKSNDTEKDFSDEDSHKVGGRIRTYKDGGTLKKPEEVEELLAMLNAYGTPKDQGALSSLVSDSTQPQEEAVASPNTRVNAFGEVYEYNEKEPAGGDPNYGSPKKLSGSERVSMDMYGFPGGGSNVTGDWITTLASLVPAVTAAPGGLGLIGSGFKSLYSPMTWRIPGMMGLTGHHVLSALGLEHMITETPEAIGEFMENPSPGQALHVTWDALMGVPAISMLRKGIPASIKAFQEAKTLARFKKGAAGEGTFLWDDTAKDWKRMTQAEQEWFNLAEEANPKLISSITEPAAESGVLQQLAGTQKALPAGEIHVRYGKETLEGMLKPLNFDDFTVLQNGVKVPKNMTWFGPANRSGKYNVPGANRFEATLDVRNPLVVNMPEVWTVERIQDIISQGYDAIVVTDATGAKVTETIPLDKSIINVIDKSKPLQQLASGSDKASNLTFQGLIESVLSIPRTITGASSKATQAMLQGERFATEYYLNTNTMERLGQLYGPIGKNQIFTPQTNKIFQKIAAGDDAIYRGLQQTFNERAAGSFLSNRLGAEHFPFELTPKQTSIGTNVNSGWGTYTNRHFPGVLIEQVGKMQGAGVWSKGDVFTPAEIKELYSKNPFGVHPERFRKSIIEIYGVEKGSKYYDRVGGLRYQAKNHLGNLKRTYGIKYPSHNSGSTFGIYKPGHYEGAIVTTVHEMNHYYFGEINLPNELIVPWMENLTLTANKHLFKPYPALAKTGFGVEYYAQPVEIQARLGELRYSLVDGILRKKGLDIDKVSDSVLQGAMNDLEVIIKSQDLGGFHKLFNNTSAGFMEGDLFVATDLGYTMRSKFADIIKGGVTDSGTFTKEKLSNLLGLLWKVPVVGAPLIIGGALQDDKAEQYNQGGALKGLIKKYRSGGSVGGWGSQGNFTTEYTSKQEGVAEIPDPNLIPEQNALDALVESGQEPLTPEEEKKLKAKKALQGAGKGAMAGASFGPWGAVVGGLVGGAVGYFAKQGAKIKKMYRRGGEASTEKEPDVNELLDMLSKHEGPPQKKSRRVDTDEWVPRHEDILQYLHSRDIDTEGNEIAKAYVIPAPFADHGEDPSDPRATGVSVKDEDGQRIRIASTHLKNPTTRIEEAIHSLQQQTLNDTSLSKVGRNKRRLYRMMKKQPWLNDLSPDKRKSITKKNYALKGSGSNQEFEAKLISAKMAMIHEGVLPSSGKVSDKDLGAIEQWYQKRKAQGDPGWESVLFRDLSNPKYRKVILKTLNKL